MGDRKFIELTPNQFNSMDIDYSKLKITSERFVIWNDKKTKCYLKYDGDCPSFLSSYNSISYETFLEMFYGTDFTAYTADEFDND